MAIVPDIKLELPFNPSILIHGKSDAGKTVLASCSPDLNPKEVTLVDKAVVGDAEGGMISLPTRGAGIIARRFPQEPNKLISTRKDLNGFIEYVRGNSKELEYASFDSIDRFQEACLDEIIREKKHERAEMQDWGDILTIFRRFLRTAPTWGVVPVFTCHTTEGVDDTDKIKKFIPYMQGAIQNQLSSYFDLVAFYEKSEDTEDRILHTKSTRRWHARSRLGSCLPDKLTNPTIPSIVDTYRERRAELIKRLKGNPRVQIVGEGGESLN
jgi:hypothetical protein